MTPHLHDPLHNLRSLIGDRNSVLPDQFLLGRRRTLTAEQRLMLAVLEDALDRIQRHGGGRQVAAELAWVASHDPCWPFSFVNVCDALSLDPDRVRRAVGVIVSGPPEPPRIALPIPVSPPLAAVA